MLTHLLGLLPIPARHRLFTLMGCDPATVHDWCPTFCPCDMFATAADAAPDRKAA